MYIFTANCITVTCQKSIDETFHSPIDYTRLRTSQKVKIKASPVVIYRTKPILRIPTNGISENAPHAADGGASDLTGKVTGGRDHPSTALQLTYQSCGKSLGGDRSEVM